MLSNPFYLQHCMSRNIGLFRAHRVSCCIARISSYTESSGIMNRRIPNRNRHSHNYCSCALTLNWKQTHSQSILHCYNYGVEKAHLKLCLLSSHKAFQAYTEIGQASISGWCTQDGSIVLDFVRWTVIGILAPVVMSHVRSTVYFLPGPGADVYMCC